MIETAGGAADEASHVGEPTAGDGTDGADAQSSGMCSDGGENRGGARGGDSGGGGLFKFVHGARHAGVLPCIDMAVAQMRQGGKAWVSSTGRFAYGSPHYAPVSAAQERLVKKWSEWSVQWSSGWWSSSVSSRITRWAG